MHNGAHLRAERILRKVHFSSVEARERISIVRIRRAQPWIDSEYRTVDVVGDSRYLSRASLDINRATWSRLVLPSWFIANSHDTNCCFAATRLAHVLYAHSSRFDSGDKRSRSNGLHPLDIRNSRLVLARDSERKRFDAGKRESSSTHRCLHEWQLNGRKRKTGWLSMESVIFHVIQFYPKGNLELGRERNKPQKCFVR